MTPPADGAEPALRDQLWKDLITEFRDMRRTSTRLEWLVYEQCANRIEAVLASSQSAEKGRKS